MSLGWSRFLLGIFAIQKVIRLPPFCPLRLRQQLVRHGRIAPLAGVTLAACLNAGTASALEFTFTFSGTGSPTSPATVTGLISGLLDNTNDQKIALTATTTSATTTPAEGWPVYQTGSGTGIDVSGGLITYSDLQSNDSSTLSVLTLYIPGLSRLNGFLSGMSNSSSTASLWFSHLPPLHPRQLSLVP